jgi:HEAT repeat protein/TolA-binding protein
MKTLIVGMAAAAGLCVAQGPEEREIRRAMEEARRAVQESARAEMDARRQIEQKLRALSESERAEEMAVAQARIAALQAEFEQQAGQFSFALQQPPQPPQPPQPAAAPRPGHEDIPPAHMMHRWSEDRLYQQAQRLLAERQHERAVEYFTAAAQKKGPKADGALYWKAYALNRLGKRDEARATIEELRKASPNSRWMGEVKALEMEIRQRSGQPTSPESEPDEDLRLIAAAGIANSEPERAVPLVAKMLDSASSLRFKERALYVLAQTRSPQALPVVMRLAKGGGSPDLQRKAIEYLGVFGAKETGPALSEIYASASEADVKRSVLSSLQRARDKERLFALAKGETNEDLRREAIEALGGMEAHEELWQLYGESSGDTKAWVLRSIGSRAGAEKLLELARNEKDVKARSAAVQMLGRVRTQQAADALIALYASESETTIRRSVVSGLYNQGNARALVEIARKETNPELKRYIVERLSNMRSKEANDYLVELLNK